MVASFVGPKNLEDVSTITDISERLELGFFHYLSGTTMEMFKHAQQWQGTVSCSQRLGN